MRLKKQVLMVDGYNMIGYWPDLIEIRKTSSIEDARDALLEILSSYSSYKNYQTIVVFDAQFVPGIEQQYKYKNLTVVFTKEDETADAYIERTADDVNSLTTQVTVATSDYAVQKMILSKGAARKSARELYNDVQEARHDLAMEAGETRVRLGRRRHSPWSLEDQRLLSKLYQDLIDESKNNEDNQKDL